MNAKDERRENYRWRVDIPTRWGDGDPYGHVNNVIYYSWFDTAVTKMLFERRIIWLPDSPSIGLCVESKCEFLQPVEFPQTVDARVRIGRMGDKSLRFEVGLFLEGQEAPAAVGYFVHVYVDRATRRPVSLSEAQRSAIADLVV
ncbi:MAG TPA: thioesterase family protein [Caulobacterales bacterium]|nr:thioesterase family protein [Caulobacterales bacterium]